MAERALGSGDNDRITRSASWPEQDEGIVQPVSKEMDKLSRRLHQCKPPVNTGGFFFAYTPTKRENNHGVCKDTQIEND